MGHAAGKFDNLLPTSYLTEGIREHLAVLAGDDLSELALAFVEQLAKLKQHLLLFRLGHVLPIGECRLSCCNRRINLGCVCQSNVFRNDTQGWVKNGSGSARSADDVLIGNIVADDWLSHLFAFFAAALAAFSAFSISI